MAGENLTPTPSRKRQQISPSRAYSTPVSGRIAKSDWDELENIDWKLLTTPESEVYFKPRKPESEIEKACTAALTKLDKAAHKTEGLKLLLRGIESIIPQEWEVLLIYFNEDEKLPNRERPWSHTEWRKWDLVEFLTRIAGTYYKFCEVAFEDGVELVTDEVDKEFLALVADVHDLGAAAESTVISIKEWERLGTRATLDVKNFSETDLS